MAGKDAKRKSKREGESGANVLDKLDNAEAAQVLRKLLDRHCELRSEAEAIAEGMLAGISPFSVADDVENALLQFDYDDLNGRAGGHSWGYVEPSEAAEGLLEEAVEPFVSAERAEPESKVSAGHRASPCSHQMANVCYAERPQRTATPEDLRQSGPGPPQPNATLSPAPD